jgi:hypothetical protein
MGRRLSIIAFLVFSFTVCEPAHPRAQINDLVAAIQAACSCTINGVSVGNWSDKATWRIDFQAGATPSQISSANSAVAAFAVPSSTNVIPFSIFIGRWTDAEYQLLMQRRATVIAAAGTTNMFLVKQWDQAMSSGQINLALQATMTFKANLVSAGILTQARADAIFQ